MPKAQFLALEPRGLNRLQAAAYIGVGVTLFDVMVEDRRMPKPKKINGRNVWDRYALDEDFAALGEETTDNPWDDAA